MQSIGKFSVSVMQGTYFLYGMLSTGTYSASVMRVLGQIFCISEAEYWDIFSVSFILSIRTYFMYQ